MFVMHIPVAGINAGRGPGEERLRLFENMASPQPLGASRKGGVNFLFFRP
jgi:hypothetical protein